MDSGLQSPPGILEGGVLRWCARQSPRRPIFAFTHVVERGFFAWLVLTVAEPDETAHFLLQTLKPVAPVLALRRRRGAGFFVPALMSFFEGAQILFAMWGWGIAKPV